MAQYDFGTIDPPSTSGDDLADLIDQFRDAVNSNHKGTARPSYAAAGMIWVKDSVSPVEIYYFDGASDVLLGKVNTSTHALQINGVTPQVYTETVSGGAKTTFTPPSGYTIASVKVFLNGVRLMPTDYTANDGTSIVLSTLAQNGDDFLAEWF